MTIEKYPGKAQATEKLTASKREELRQRLSKKRDSMRLQREIKEEIGG